ncbi:AAA family ATPase [Actinokineospora bangkokensis]|uniref:HTH luxR-type domain-containing protein n=1 Tax=Actinokineospora bangkokensis TaxID=1193682 RepID=A0A1Q9LPC1_9PSEU|nr:LuxR family transcriptional regulator [Actinokineospora bangkokensis]OLR93882.1 hypothetical protein BJP25_14765 [Actinokineospora bangkokensis]
MLVERAAELAALTAVVDTARAGRSQVVLVGGPLGGGRTALLRAAADHAAAAGAEVLRAECAHAERDFPFGVVLQLLEPTLQRLGHGALLDRLLGGHDPGQEHALLHDTAAVVRELAELGPLVLVVDDLQWADRDSLRWLLFLAQRVRGHGVALLLARTCGLPPTDAAALADLAGVADTRVDVAPLSADGVAAVLTATAGRAPDAAFLAAAVDAGARTPVFATALGRALAEHDLAPDAAHLRRALELPLLGPAARVARYLRGGPRALVDLACAARVLGDSATPELLGELTGLPAAELAECAKTLRELGITTGDTRLLPLVAAAVWQALELLLTAGEQERLRAGAADVLYRGGGSPEVIAGHLLATTAPPPPWATDVLRVAAAAATAAGDARRATTYLRHALLHCDPDGDLRGVLLADLAAAERRYDFPTSTRHLRQALPLLSSARARAEAVCAAPVCVTGTLAIGLPRLREIAAALDADGQERELALRVRARIRFASQGDRAAVAGSALRAAELAGDFPLATAAERELTAVLAHAAMAAGTVGRDELAAAVREIVACEPASAVPTSAVLPTAVPVLLAADATDGLEPWLATALRLAEDGRDHLGAAVVGAQRAVLLAGVGSLAQARQAAEEALGRLEHPLFDVSANCAIALATVAGEQHDSELATAALHACGREPDGLLSPSLRSLLHGTVSWTGGDLAAAAEHFADLGRQLEDEGVANPGLTPWRLRVASLCDRMGEHQRAVRLAEEEQERVRLWGAPAAIGRALRVRAVLAGDHGGRALLREAIEVLEGSGNRLELGKALVLLGRRTLADDRAGAEALLRRGHGLATRCGATRLAEQAALALGGEAPASAPDAASLLTPAERRVAELVVAGQRNREIADELGVSLRAVEKTLTGAYRKLGVSGRADFARAVQDLRGPRAG